MTHALILKLLILVIMVCIQPQLDHFFCHEVMDLQRPSFALSPTWTRDRELRASSVYRLQFDPPRRQVGQMLRVPEKHWLALFMSRSGPVKLIETSHYPIIHYQSVINE